MRLAHDVRMVVAGEAGEAVGAMLHPTEDLIVATTPGTPAAKLSPEALSELLGMPWATEARTRALERLVGAEYRPPDGGVRLAIFDQRKP